MSFDPLLKSRIEVRTRHSAWWSILFGLLESRTLPAFVLPDIDMWRRRSRSLNCFLMIRFGLNTLCLPPYLSRSHRTHVSPVTGQGGLFVSSGVSQISSRQRAVSPFITQGIQLSFLFKVHGDSEAVSVFCLLTSPPKLPYPVRTCA